MPGAKDSAAGQSQLPSRRALRVMRARDFFLRAAMLHGSLANAAARGARHSSSSKWGRVYFRGCPVRKIDPSPFSRIATLGTEVSRAPYGCNGQFAALPGTSLVSPQGSPTMAWMPRPKRRKRTERTTQMSPTHPDLDEVVRHAATL